LRYSDITRGARSAWSAGALQSGAKNLDEPAELSDDQAESLAAAALKLRIDKLDSKKRIDK
jgi:hypothetical protein